MFRGLRRPWSRAFVLFVGLATGSAYAQPPTGAEVRRGGRDAAAPLVFADRTVAPRKADNRQTGTGSVVSESLEPRPRRAELLSSLISATLGDSAPDSLLGTWLVFAHGVQSAHTESRSRAKRTRQSGVLLALATDADAAVITDHEGNPHVFTPGSTLPGERWRLVRIATDFVEVERVEPYRGASIATELRIGSSLDEAEALLHDAPLGPSARTLIFQQVGSEAHAVDAAASPADGSANLPDSSADHQ
jgi:hypothetical protein